MAQEIRTSGETPRRRASRDRIRSVTSGDFSHLVLHAQGCIAVEFMSYSCVHCRAIEPVLQQVAEAVESEVTIYRVNIPVEQQLAAEFSIEGTPTFIMFLNGSVVGRVEGPPPTFSSVLATVTQPFGIDDNAISANAG